MATSWTEFRGQVKSRCSAWTRAFWLSRKKFAERCRRLRGERAELQDRVRALEVELQRERQHSKSGFTSLIATFGCLLRRATPATIRSAFERVKVKDVRAWLRNNLPKTLTAKRLTTYREFNATQLGATKTPATT